MAKVNLKEAKQEVALVSMFPVTTSLHGNLILSSNVALPASAAIFVERASSYLTSPVGEYTFPNLTKLPEELANATSLDSSTHVLVGSL